MDFNKFSERVPLNSIKKTFPEILRKALSNLTRLGNLEKNIGGIKTTDNPNKNKNSIPIDRSIPAKDYGHGNNDREE